VLSIGSRAHRFSPPQNISVASHHSVILHALVMSITDSLPRQWQGFGGQGLPSAYGIRDESTAVDSRQSRRARHNVGCRNRSGSAQAFEQVVPHPSCKAMLMPHYFFNTRIGTNLISDPKGAELRDPDHAWEVARTLILEILRDQSGQPNLLTATLEVTDEQGELVLEFPFSEALIPLPDEPPSKH
jgi:hypothetical protein